MLMTAKRTTRGFLMMASLLALTGCMGDQAYVSNMNDNADGFGGATTHNELVATGQLNYAIDLARRFRQEVPTTVNFAFDQATLDANAQAVLRKQAAFIRHFPEVRFRVFGYTDLVGSEAYNKGLGMRRARAVVAFLVSQGVPASHLQAVISYGKTRPLIPVQAPERANRRAVTDVWGFVQSAPMVLDGKYAEIVYRSYVASAIEKPSSTSATSSSSSSSGSGSGSASGLSGNTLPGGSGN